ncbi:MAG: tetratricopeptide repeat protein [Cyanobacteriota bacterium]
MYKNLLLLLMIIFISISGCYAKRTAEFYIELGDNLRYEGNYKASIKYYNKAIDIDDKLSDAYYGLAQSYLYSNQVDLAIENYKKLLKLKDDTYYYTYLAEAYEKNGQYDEAIKTYKKLFTREKKDPYLGIYRYKIGKIYEKQEKFNEAIECYKESIKEDDKTKPYYIYYLDLGIVYSKINEKELAIEYLNKSININKNCYEGYYNLGLILEKENNLKQAKNNYEKALKILPEYKDAKERLLNINKLL